MMDLLNCATVVICPHLCNTSLGLVISYQIACLVSQKRFQGFIVYDLDFHSQTLTIHLSTPSCIQ